MRANKNDEPPNQTINEPNYYIKIPTPDNNYEIYKPKLNFHKSSLLKI